MDLNGVEFVNVGDSKPPSNLPEVLVRIQQLITRIPSEQKTAALRDGDLDSLREWCVEMEWVLIDFRSTLELTPLMDGYAAIRDMAYVLGTQTGHMGACMSNVLRPPKKSQVKTILTRTIPNVVHAEGLVVERTESTFEYETVVTNLVEFDNVCKKAREDAHLNRMLVFGWLMQMAQTIGNYVYAMAMMGLPLGAV